MRGRTVLTVLTMAALTVGLASCGPSNGLNLAPVRGKVTYKGEPVTYGSISLHPDEAKGTSGPLAMGSINRDGTFILSTEVSGDGAIVGLHRVAILGLDPSPVNSKAMPTPEEDPLKYLTAKTQAGLSAAKAAGRKSTENDANDHRSQRKTYRIVVPEKLGKPDTSNITAKVVSGSNYLNISIDENGNAEIKTDAVGPQSPASRPLVVLPWDRRVPVAIAGCPR